MLTLAIDWIIDSLSTIKDKNDPLLAGGFTGSVMEILGRVLLFPDGEGDNKSKECFYEFIEKYLKEYNFKYEIHKETLWKFSRCDGAHSALPQYGVIFSGDANAKDRHLKVRSDILDDKGMRVDGRFLVIFLPTFVDDLICSVRRFNADLERDNSLREKEQKVVNRLFSKGQKYINDNFPLDD